MKKVTIFCSSSSGIDKKYFRPILKLVQHLVDSNIEIICGGGSGGMMGKVAKLCHDYKGRTIGIRPNFINKLEKPSQYLSEVIIVSDIWERKKKMIELSDGIIVLPGGSGTLDELFEVITLKRLGQYNKPIVIFNIENYFDELIRFYKYQIEENFMHISSMNILTVVLNSDEIINALSKDMWNNENINNAIIKE